MTTTIFVLNLLAVRARCFVYDARSLSARLSIIDETFSGLLNGLVPFIPGRIVT